jgi:mannose-6-phosphate isomerase-like protein (cupin superfamily)
MSHHDTLTAAVLLDSPATAGAVSVIEVALPPRWDGPPLHHHDFDEAFYVLDGELTFMVGDQLREAGPGTMTFAPRGTHHTLANCADVPARYLLTCTPAGFERMFKRLAARVAGTEPDAEALEPFPETVVVGPTLFEHLGR